ncbi:hypothetical protein F4809DRAFT_596850 [Biscogniauxia mediterranea]|nr:hypothetical protein F4809DRAFT_596850 [Biscogniauxia mediterranea]
MGLKFSIIYIYINMHTLVFHEFWGDRTPPAPPTPLFFSFPLSSPLTYYMPAQMVGWLVGWLVSIFIR